jgi:hypothetical protein
MFKITFLLTNTFKLRNIPKSIKTTSNTQTCLHKGGVHSYRN